MDRNPSASRARFLRAYHDLMFDHKVAVHRPLQRVIALQARDRLAAGLLASLDRQSN